MVSVIEGFHCIHMYYCTSESGIWLDIAHVRLYLHELEPSKNAPHKSMFSYYSTLMSIVTCSLPSFKVLAKVHSNCNINTNFGLGGC